MTGNNVLIGPAAVGLGQSIGLTPNGLAQVVMAVSSGVAPLHQGTVARIYENSLSGIANKYVVLEPGPANAPPIPAAALIAVERTPTREVSLDQLFDSLDPLTRTGCATSSRGEAASIQGRREAANRTLQYLAPGARRARAT